MGPCGREHVSERIRALHFESAGAHAAGALAAAALTSVTSGSADQYVISTSCDAPVRPSCEMHLLLSNKTSHAYTEFKHIPIVSP